MRSLLDSFIEFDKNSAALSILKLGTRTVGCVETLDCENRKLIIFSFVKTPLKDISFDGSSSIFSILDLKEHQHVGRVIYVEKVIYGSQLITINELLQSIDELKDKPRKDWSSSYLISIDTLNKILHYIAESRANPPIYASINRHSYSNYASKNNHSWFVDLLEKGGLGFCSLSNDQDPGSYSGSYFKSLLDIYIFCSEFLFGEYISIAECAYNDNFTEVQRMVNSGANIDKKLALGVIGMVFRYLMCREIVYYSGFSALMFAVCKKNYNMVKLLVNNNADTDLTVKIKGQEYTAMDFAILLKLPDIIGFLYDLDAKHHIALDKYNSVGYDIITKANLAKFHDLNITSQTSHASTNWPESDRLLSACNKSSNFHHIVSSPKEKSNQYHGDKTLEEKQYRFRN